MFATCLLVTLSLGLTEAAFSWTNCSPADSPLKITNIEIGPDPVVIPGELQLTVAGQSNAPLGSASLSVSLKRKTFLGEIPIPCLLNIGSCKYDDICTLVDTMISEDWAGIMADVGGQIKAMLSANGVDASMCPQPAQTLNIDHASLHLPEVPAVLTFFAAGDYHANIVVTDNASQATILCLDAQLTIKEEGCTGLACLFGRK